MNGKICVITGANAGLGFEAARQLAKLGAEVVLVCRNKEKGDEARRIIIRDTGNPAVSLLVADLSLKSQIIALSEEIHRRYPKIDVLINNAGAVHASFERTAEGLEKTIATNHFSYFLLTNYLLDLISRSDYARILNVASNNHYRSKIDFASFTENRGYNIMKAYGQSKLANMLFTRELADRLKHTHITVNAISPGRVTTQIGNKSKNRLFSFIWSALTYFSSIPPEEGCRTYVYLATSGEVNGVSGKYFHESKPREPSRMSLDKALAGQLWRESERLAGVQFTPLILADNPLNG